MYFKVCKYIYIYTYINTGIKIYLNIFHSTLEKYIATPQVCTLFIKNTLYSAICFWVEFKP